MDKQQLIGAFLAGGLSGAIVTGVIDVLRQRTDRGFNLLNDKIKLLYGPLYYYLSQNKKLFEASDTLLKAGSKAYHNCGGGMDMVHGVNKTILVAQVYFSQVKQNNKKIIKILEENFCLAESNDYDSFIEFTKDYFRLVFEKPNADGGGAPFEVAIELPPISILDPKFFEMVEASYMRLSKRLEDYCDVK